MNTELAIDQALPAASFPEAAGRQAQTAATAKPACAQAQETSVWAAARGLRSEPAHRFEFMVWLILGGVSLALLVLSF